MNVDRRILDFKDHGVEFRNQLVLPDAYETAQILWSAGVVKIDTENPNKISCGWKVPIYFNNRLITTKPHHYRALQDRMISFIGEKELQFDVIAGIPTGALPHSIGLSWTIQESSFPFPSVYVPKVLKSYGDPNAIVGGDIFGQRVLVIEDHITTGESAITAIEILKQTTEVVACLSITEHGFSIAMQNFANVGVPHYSLTTAKAVIEVGANQGLITSQQLATLEDFYSDPETWEFRSGHTVVHDRIGLTDIGPDGKPKKFTKALDYM